MIDAMPRGSAREKTKASQRDSGGMSLATLGWYLFCFMMPLGNTTLSVLVFGVALGIGLKEPENRRALARILRGNRVAQAMTLFVCILFVSAAFSSHKTLALAGAFGYSLVILLPLLAGLLWNIPTADWILSRGLVCLGLGGLISASVALYRAYVLHVWRPGGAFISTNGFASVIMLTLLISWWGMTVPDVRQSIWLRLCRLGNWLIMLWSFIMAQGRGPGLALLWALFFITCGPWRRSGCRGYLGFLSAWHSRKSKACSTLSQHPCSQRLHRAHMDLARIFGHVEGPSATGDRAGYFYA